MATDPQTLLSQAACYACYLEMDNLLVLTLMAQWLSGTNLIPVGSRYNNGGNGPVITLVPGQSYHVTLIPPLAGTDLNASYSNGTGNAQINAPVTRFAFTPQPFGGICVISFVSGVMNSVVSAILVTP